MRREVKLLDVVALLEDVQAEGVLLQRGEVGAVVEILAPDVYEVEFCDDQGRAYAFSSLHAEQFLVLHNHGKVSGTFLQLLYEKPLAKMLDHNPCHPPFVIGGKADIHVPVNVFPHTRYGMVSEVHRQCISLRVVVDP